MVVSGLLPNSSKADSFSLINSLGLKNKTEQVEDLILMNKLDSAELILSSIPSSAYLLILDKIIKKENPDYMDFYLFVESILSRETAQYELLSKFIDTRVFMPEESLEINMNYVKIKRLQALALRDELLDLAESSKKNEELEKYIARFNPEQNDVKRARILASTHDIVMAQIQQNLEKGKALCYENEVISKQLNDTSLLILSLYHLTDFLLYENKLDEYIQISEQCYELDSGRSVKSDYHIGNLMHLINAYIFKGGYKSRVSSLLKELYDSPKGKKNSYSLYAQFLSTLPVDDAITKQILQMFGVNTVYEFCELIAHEAEKKLNLNELFHVINESSKALVNAGFYEEAIVYSNQANIITRKIYTEELAQNLAEYETNLVLMEKELEIEHEREKTSLYIIISSLTGIVLLITLIGLIMNNSRARTLKAKNSEIEFQRRELEKKDKEKETLLKELQHRVKNNFQIILNLLDMQIMDLEDTQAIAPLREGTNRIKSMAFIHQLFMANENEDIEIRRYIEKLVSEISNSFKLENPPLVNIEVEDIILDMDTAIPLGLILNELVTNAFKYGFSVDEKLLSIYLKSTEIKGNYTLCITDNGQGFPKDFDIKNGHSLGLRLVTRLSKQLHGTIEIKQTKNCMVTVYFKNREGRELENI